MKRIILLLVIVGVAVVLAFMSLPEDPGQLDRRDTVVKQLPTDEAIAEREAEQAAVESARDERLQAMQVEYKKLERARRDLRTRLQEVAYYLSEADLPEEEGRRMRHEIGVANQVLINPPLLGAFNGVADIERELKRIDRINQQLDEFENIIRQNGGYAETG